MKIIIIVFFESIYLLIFLSFAIPQVNKQYKRIENIGNKK